MAYQGAYTGAQVDTAIAKALVMPEFKGEAANFAALPAAGTAGDMWLVLNGTGVWPFNRKSAGFYRDDGASWVHMGWDIASLQTDSNWAIRDNTDNSKLMKFEVSSVSTGTTRTVTIPDKDITIADDGDIPASGPGGYEPYDAANAKTDALQTFSVSQRGSITTLTDGATVTPDFNNTNHFSLTTAASQTIANPTNLASAVGQSGVFMIDSGGFSPSWGTAWQFENDTAPTLSGKCLIPYYVDSATTVQLGDASVDRA